MGGSSSDASSFSSSSSSSYAGSRRKRSRRHHRDKKRRRKDDHNHDGATTTPAASSDWDELRAHFQFVLPTEDDDHSIINVSNNINHSNTQKYGSKWQERMVQHYHSHLYKEYVLADLSRVMDLGKVGLRWRTEKEVANGKGFRCCGNLRCEIPGNASANTRDVGDDDNDRKAYAAAAKRHMGIAVPENGGKDPMGVVLPPSEDANQSLESYLQSCAEEKRKMHEGEQDGHSRRKKHHHHKKSKHKRSHNHRHSKGDKLSSSCRTSYSLKDQEQMEQERLSCLTFGIGLHDYEVDFVYVEQGQTKRELVKVRLCLRCAPLLFVPKMNDSCKNEKGDRSSKNGGKEKKAPAVKAREAREKAARSHAEMANANNAAANGYVHTNSNNASIN